MINSLEEKVLVLTEKVDKMSSLVDRQEQYSRRYCILIHDVKENQNEGTDEVVVNKLKSEMDLEISPGDIDRTYRIGVPSIGKNRPIIVKFVRHMDRRRVFTNKKRLKGKSISITENLTKVRMSALKEARNKFGYCSVWTADGKIIKTKEIQRPKFILIDIVANRCCVTEKQKLFLVLMAFVYFYLSGGFFTKHSKAVSYFGFLILFIGILRLIK